MLMQINPIKTINQPQSPEKDDSFSVSYYNFEGKTVSIVPWSGVWEYENNNRKKSSTSSFIIEEDGYPLNEWELWEKKLSLNQIKKESFKEKFEEAHWFMLHPEATKELFINSLGDFSEKEQKEIIDTTNFAIKKHEWQKRDEWTPYYGHLLYVAYRVIKSGGSLNDIKAALLHDTLEDTDTTEKELQDINNEVFNKVKLLTKKFPWKDKIPMEIYLNNMTQDEGVILIKWCDRLSNLYSLTSSPIEKQERYIKETTEILLPFFQKNNDNIYQEMLQATEYINEKIELYKKKESLKKIPWDLAEILNTSNHKSINKII